MLLFFISLFTLFTQHCEAIPPTVCSCYREFLGNQVIHQFNECQVAIDKKYLYEVKIARKDYERECREKIKELQSMCPSIESLRYSDVHQNILVLEKRVDLMTERWLKWFYQLHMSPGWNYTLEEKQEMIRTEQDRVRGDARFSKQLLNEFSDRIHDLYFQLFEICTKKHFCVSTYNDYGFFSYLHNDFDHSVDLLFQLVDFAQETGQMHELDAIHHSLGTICIEAMVYDKAIEYLSLAIQADPDKKQAHFDRALAYFETGIFDLAIEDFLDSHRGEHLNQLGSEREASEEFIAALLQGIKNGSANAAIDYVPWKIWCRHFSRRSHLQGCRSF